MEGFALAAIELRDDDGFLAGAPLFQTSYRFDTPIQGWRDGYLKRAVGRFATLTEWKLLGVGSPFADRCHIALRSGLSAERREQTLTALAEAIEAEARARNASLIAFKDLSGEEYDGLAPALKERGYGAIRSLPVAVLDVPEGGVDTFLSKLSASTRKDIKRKLKGDDGIRIEHRTSIADVAERIEDLYQSTRLQSSVDYGQFEELPKNYFASVAAHMKDRARFILYWHGEELVAFNLLLVGRDRVIDKFLGMSYPLAREKNLYAKSWIENVKFCQEIGCRYLQTGQTVYADKVRFGSALLPSWILVKHRNRIFQSLLRAATPLLAFDRWDPDLRKLKSVAS